jgi:dihydroorotase
MTNLFKQIIFILATCFCFMAFGQSSIGYDIVLVGGRVIDPESELDTIKNIGILNSRIAQISSEPLKGRQMIDVSGLVVAPGFIDLHVHGRSNEEQKYQLYDGLTTALELEWGIEFLQEWYESRKSNALINYGASVCWPFERFKAIDKYKDAVKELYQTTVAGESKISTLFNTIGPSYTESLSPGETNMMLANLRTSLDEGGIGIGVPIGYLPKNDPGEMFQVYQFAAALDALVFSHVREPNINSIQEAIADAVITGVPLHIVHINSMSLGNIQLALDMIDMARRKGFEITTELYPYTAASTLLQSAMFNEGWQERLGMTYSDLQWVSTGERLNKETFETYRKAGGSVIMHMMKPEWIKTGISSPGTIIASDGMPYAPLAHPRTAGTYARVLGKYVREEKVIDLFTAIEKMTLLPAKILEGMAPMMRYKGRIQIGADADITIFNPKTVIDRASFEGGLEFSEGIEYVIVNGVVVLENGAIVPGTFPGQPVYGKYKK